MICQPTDVELEVIMNRISNGDINLQPDFQRGEVWSDNKKRKLIDTILRGWKIPPVHMISNESNIDEVLDGQQRLAAIRDFYNGKFTIDGEIQPLDKKVKELNGLYYYQLPVEIQRTLKKYSITIIRLTEYKPEEPAELFYRLNQPATLTSAEQRNAYIGETRNQVKQLVDEFETMGADKQIIGFSNSRLAYDEIISKFAFMIDTNTLKKKVTAGDISKRYREDIVFSTNTITLVRATLQKYVLCMIGFKDKYMYYPKLSKSTLISWLIYIASNDRELEDYQELIFRFELTRNYLKNKMQNIFLEEYSHSVMYMLAQYPFLEAMMNIYNQRASMGSTDALSIIYRDIIISVFNDMIKEKTSDLLNTTMRLYQESQNMYYVLDYINQNYCWGDTIR